MSIKNFILRIPVYVCLGLFACCSNEDNFIKPDKHPFESKQLIGHRGDCSNAPENTMPSFEYAVNVLGLKWIECDPVMTKDSVIVLNHGKSIDDHSNGTGRVEEMTYDELCRFDFGHHQKFGDKFKGTKICTAQEVIRFAKRHKVIVEFDFSHFNASPQKVKLLHDIVQQNDYLNYTVFDPYHAEDLGMISEVTTNVAICVFTLDSNLVAPAELYRFKNVFIDLNQKKLVNGSGIPDKIHKLGYKAITELINPVPLNPIEKLRVLFNSGFDYIYTEGIPRSVIEK